MGDEWDDLFAKAEGLCSRTTAEVKNLDKLNKKRSFESRDSEVYSSYLEERWNVTPSWPYYLELKGSMNTRAKCSCYNEDKDSVCKTCGQPTWRHWTKVSEVEKISSTANLVCTLRNVRCAALQAAITVVQNNTEDFIFQRCIWKKLGRQWNRHSSQYRDPDIHEKCQAVTRNLSLWTNAAAAAFGQSHSKFEASIRLALACDAVYYKVYYNQLTSAVSERSNVLLLVPHPVSYFGLIASPSATQKERLVSSDEIDESIQQFWGLETINDEDKHPLQVIHKHRHFETRFLFQQLPFDLPSRERRLEPHDAMAPDLLMDWRDSCRDFICHLYAYATVPPRAIRRIVQLARKESGNRGILEIGAGTGYLAKMLRRKGVAVEAFDMLPTSAELNSSWNDYHGQTPPFSSIHQGDERVVSRQEKPIRQILLLCYPPPESEFAYECLNRFINGGGSCFVFIGEFRGLTGSSSFERLLVKSFRLIDRIPCYNWGCDASYVTIWERKASTDTAIEKSLLLPCLHCHRNESTRRSQLVRFLSYCSPSCYNKGEDCRSIHFKLASVYLRADSTRFEDADHMAAVGQE